MATYHRKRKWVLPLNQSVDTGPAITLLLILDATTATVLLVSNIIIIIPRTLSLRTIKKCLSSSPPMCFAIANSLFSDPKIWVFFWRNAFCALTHRRRARTWLRTSKSTIRKKTLQSFLSLQLTNLSILFKSSSTLLYLVTRLYDPYLINHGNIQAQTCISGQLQAALNQLSVLQTLPQTISINSLCTMPHAR